MGRKYPYSKKNLQEATLIFKMFYRSYPLDTARTKEIRDAKIEKKDSCNRSDKEYRER